MSTVLCGKMLVYLFNVSEAEKKDYRLTKASNNTIQQASSCWKAEFDSIHTSALGDIESRYILTYNFIFNYNYLSI